MEAVTSLAIGIGIFVIVAVIYSKFVVKNGTLESLPALADEETLFEETKVRVRQIGKPRSALFLSCTVRVTNHRIIVAQKALLARQHVLHLVATYSDPAGAGFELGSSVRTAGVVTSVPRRQITVTEEPRAGLSIPLGGGLATGQTMLIESKRLDELTAALDRASA